VSATEHSSREPRVSAATAAAWRRRLRARQALPPLAETDWKRGAQVPAATDSAAMAAPDTIALDFEESQQAGLAAMICLAEPQGPPAPPAIETYRLWPGLPVPWSGPDTARPRPGRMAVLAEPGQATAPAPGEPDRRATSAPPTLFPPAMSPSTKPARGRMRRMAGSSPAPGYMAVLGLIAILTVQAVLSLRLVWSNTAYIDEATYLWAGHLEIVHVLRGGAIPPFQTWFSGGPVLYPPVAALADHAGGLIGARLLSLGCMTGATALLWNLTRRLFDGRAAFFAAALFAVLGPTQFLGALATYDAMALLLVAISAWCVVAARDRGDSTPLLVAGAAALALANATKYATALFDPVIVALAALVISDQRSGKSAIGRAGYLAAFVTALVAALLALGGPFYMAGVMYTTLARAAGNNPPLLVLEDSWKWAGSVGILAWAGVVICTRRDGRGRAAVLTVLAVAGLLAPMEQARIHTITSLHKHVDFGAWLAAPAAGYALAQLSRIIGKRRGVGLAAAGLMTAAILPMGALGAQQAKNLFQGWPDSSPAIAKLRGLTRAYPGRYLAEDYDIPAYYLRGSVSWPRWSNTWYLSYTRPGTGRPLTGAAAYQAAIAEHSFSLVILDFLATPRTDSEIVTAMQKAGGYQVVAVVPSSFGQYTIWARRPAQVPERMYGHR
jgi:4-amino-4-deoxy-L-arabinose transferase-like glycosyltransferase